MSNYSTCGCNQPSKIELPTAYFKVDNYFSELMSEWEREAAKANLGIKELVNIEYFLDERDFLQKVRFTYKQGHDEISKVFTIAPKGEKGDPFTWNDLTIQQKESLRGDQGLPGVTPTLGRVVVSWTNDGHEHGEFIQDSCATNGYTLYLYLTKPDAIKELSNILDNITKQLKDFYVSKAELEVRLDQLAQDLAKNLNINIDFQRIGDDLVLYVKGQPYKVSLPKYTITKDGSTVKFAKDGSVLSEFDTISIATPTTLGGIKTGYVGNSGVPVKVDEQGQAYVKMSAFTTKIYFKITGSWSKPPKYPDIDWIEDKPDELPNMYIWCALVVDDTLKAIYRITPVDGKDGEPGTDGTSAEQGLVGAVIRQRGKWVADAEYRNDLNYQPSDKLTIRWIDVVYVEDETTGAKTYYMVKPKDKAQRIVVGIEPGKNTTESQNAWQEAKNLSFAYIETLISNYVDAKYIQAKEIRIYKDEDELEIVAGMTSGKAIKNEEFVQLPDDSIRIWAGKTLFEEDGVNKINLTKAPFRVTESGAMYADNANILGAINVSQLILNNRLKLNERSYYYDEDVTLFNVAGHQIIFVFTASSERKVKSAGVVDLIYVYDANGKETRINSYTLLPKSAYLLISITTLENNTIWRLVELNSAVLTGGTCSKDFEAKLGSGNNVVSLSNGILTFTFVNLPLELKTYSSLKSTSIYPVVKYETSQNGMTPIYTTGSYSGQVGQLPSSVVNNMLKLWYAGLTNSVVTGTWTNVKVELNAQLPSINIHKQNAYADINSLLTDQSGGNWCKIGVLNNTVVAALNINQSTISNQISDNIGGAEIERDAVFYIKITSFEDTTGVFTVSTEAAPANIMKNGSIVVNGKVVGEKTIDDGTSTYTNYSTETILVMEASTSSPMYAKVPSGKYVKWSDTISAGAVWKPSITEAMAVDMNAEFNGGELVGPAVTF